MSISNVVCESEMFTSVCFYVLLDLFYLLDHLFGILKLIYSSFFLFIVVCFEIFLGRSVIDIYFLLIFICLQIVGQSIMQQLML